MQLNKPKHFHDLNTVCALRDLVVPDQSLRCTKFLGMGPVPFFILFHLSIKRNNKSSSVVHRVVHWGKQANWSHVSIFLQAKITREQINNNFWVINRVINTFYKEKIKVTFFSFYYKLVFMLENNLKLYKVLFLQNISVLPVNRFIQLDLTITQHAAILPWFYLLLHWCQVFNGLEDSLVTKDTKFHMLIFYL